MITVTKKQLQRALLHYLYAPQSNQLLHNCLQTHPVKKTQPGQLLQYEHLFLLNSNPNYHSEQLYHLYDNEQVFDYGGPTVFLFHETHDAYLIPFKIAFVKHNQVLLKAQETRIVNQLFQARERLSLSEIQVIIRKRYPITGHRFPLQKALNALVQSGIIKQYQPQVNTIRYKITTNVPLKNKPHQTRTAYQFLIEQTFLRHGVVTLATLHHYFGLNQRLTTNYVADLIKQQKLRLVKLTGVGVRYVHTDFYHHLAQANTNEQQLHIIPLTDLLPDSNRINDCLCLVDGKVVGETIYDYDFKLSKITVKTIYHRALSKEIRDAFAQKAEQIRRLFVDTSRN